MLIISCMRQTCSGLSCFNKFSQLRNVPKRTFFKKSSGGPRLQPPSYYPFQTEELGFSSLLKPFIFTVCFSGGVFACSALWQYEGMRKKARQFGRFNAWFQHGSSRSHNGPISRLWNTQTEGQKVASVIIALNSVVFLLWRVPQLLPFMTKYFCATPALKNSCWPMFLSTFSHYSFFHMAGNMFVLYSFSSSSVAFFGKEQFVAFYCSAGVVSSFASYLYKIAVGSYGPSLGASGALLSILSSSCVQFPQARIALIFLPFFTISAGTAIKAIMALDFVGMVARWRFFDHAAHFGGAIYGILYLYYGQKEIWNRREPLVTWWHKLRGKPK